MGVIKWTIDPQHSEVRFKVKHLMISTVTGSFTSFDGTIKTYNEDLKNGKSIDFHAEVSSLFTNNPERDAHLRSADFFDADLYPKISFKAAKFDLKKEELTGNLSIKGNTHPILLKITIGGIAEDDRNQIRAGISAEGKISRKAFGLTWNDITHAGNVVVGDQVTLLAELELIRQPQ